MILHVLIAMGAGGRPRHQPQVIPSLRQETRLLTGTRQGHRRRLTDTDRRRLAALASPRGRKRLQELATLATPDRLLRWPRCLRAQKFNGRTRRPQRGRPPVAEEIERLAVQMAAEHPTWGDRRLQGAWATLGDPMDHLPGRHRLRRRHLNPAPQRRQAGRRWAQVLTRPWEVLAATDGFTGEVATWHGLVTYDVWVIMDLATWQVHMAGMTPQPTAAFMPPCARQLTPPSMDSSAGHALLSMTGTPNSLQRSRASSGAAGWNLSSYRRGRRISMPTVNGVCVPSQRKRFGRGSCGVHDRSRMCGINIWHRIIQHAIIRGATIT